MVIEHGRSETKSRQNVRCKTSKTLKGGKGREASQRSDEGGRREAILESMNGPGVNMCIGLISSLQEHVCIAQRQTPVIWKSAIGLGAFSRVEWKLASCEHREDTVRLG